MERIHLPYISNVIISTTVTVVREEVVISRPSLRRRRCWVTPTLVRGIIKSGFNLPVLPHNVYCLILPVQSRRKDCGARLAPQLKTNFSYRLNFPRSYCSKWALGYSLLKTLRDIDRLRNKQLHRPMKCNRRNSNDNEERKCGNTSSFITSNSTNDSNSNSTSKTNTNAKSNSNGNNML